MRGILQKGSGDYGPVHRDPVYFIRNQYKNESKCRTVMDDEVQRYLGKIKRLHVLFAGLLRTTSEVFFTLALKLPVSVRTVGGAQRQGSDYPQNTN